MQLEHKIMQAKTIDLHVFDFIRQKILKIAYLTIVLIQLKF